MDLNKKHHLTRYDWMFIIAAWVSTQLILYIIYGINNREESLTYISFVEGLLNGTAKFGLHRLWYSGYMALLALVKVLALPYEIMYVIQLVLSFVSLIYFMRIVSLWMKSRVALILSGLLYSTCFLVHQWVNHLFTDAVFLFLLAIAIYYLIDQRTLRHKIIFWVLLIILPFFRPVGFLFVVVACLHWIFTYQKENVIKIVAASVYLSILLLLVYKSIVIDSGYFYPFNNLHAEIICGRPSDLLQYQAVPYTKDTKIVEYFWQNPEMTARLFLHRFYKTFSMTRSYFSAAHNMVIAIACVIYYALALIGVFHVLLKKLKGRYFLLAGCFIFCVPCVVFCVEWHGRTSLPILYFVILMSAIGMDAILRRFSY
jgi:hypothetical protein